MESEKIRRKIEIVKNYFLNFEGKEVTDEEIIEMALDRLMLDLQVKLLFKRVVDYVRKYD